MKKFWSVLVLIVFGAGLVLSEGNDINKNVANTSLKNSVADKSSSLIAQTVKSAGKKKSRVIIAKKSPCEREVDKLKVEVQRLENTIKRLKAENYKLKRAINKSRKILNDTK
ncbi:MAG: hypothetical protein U9R41_02970 [Candidatus Marinimicrobia bacterium]|nr:hypothetical protein [Candidatus Neomarinimicrobiota bacterium]